MVDNNTIQKCKTCKKTSDKNPKLKWVDKDLCLECFNKPKPKFYFDVKVEAMLPATLTYRVFAENAEQAAQMIKNLQPTMVKHKLIGRKELKLIVYDAGSSIIKLVLNLWNR